MSLAMQNLVTGVLSRPEVSKIRCTLGDLEVTPSTFRLVRDKIFSGKIAVVHIAGADNEALIVHECVHASADMASLSVKVGLEEATAYVAQCLYFYYRNEEALSEPGVKPTFADPILREAWAVAMLARGKEKLEDKDVAKLLRAIADHPLYKKTHAATRHYDGVL